MIRSIYIICPLVFCCRPHYSVSHEMDIICFCSVSVTITTLKLHCFNALRRWKFSPYLLCVCLCVNVWELSQFPFQMSSYLRAGEQRPSQRPLFHRCSFRGRREGGGTSAAIYGGAGIPPPQWQGNPSLFDSRSASTTGKLTGWWWARWERGGDRREARSLHHHRLRVTQPFWSTALVFSFPHVDVNEHMLARTHMFTCSLTKYYWQGQDRRK